MNLQAASVSDAVQALQESEERFRILAEAAFEAIALIADDRILDVNPGFLTLFQYDKREIVGAPASDFFPTPFRYVLPSLQDTAEEEPYQAVCRRKNGTLFHAEIRGKAMPFGGRDVRVTAIRDITVYKNDETRLRRSHDILENLVSERTQALTEVNQRLLDKIAELEAFEQAVVGRELKMMALEKENARLRAIVAQGHCTTEISHAS
jgi:PAS domain S-box-containing protein